MNNTQHAQPTVADLFAALDRIRDRGFSIQALSVTGSSWLIDVLRALLPPEDFAARSAGQGARNDLDQVDLIEIAHDLKAIIVPGLQTIEPGRTVVPDYLIAVVKEASMVRSKIEESIQPSLEPGPAVALLRTRTELARQLKKAGQPIKPEDWRSWYDATEDIVVKAVGSASQRAQGFHSIGRPMNILVNPSPAQMAARYAAFLDQAMVALDAMIESIGTEASLSPTVAAGTTIDAVSRAQDTGKDARKVFIIHGRNVVAARELARFIRAMDLVALDFDELRSRMSGTATVLDIVSAGMSECQAVIALFTGDEWATLDPRFHGAHDAPKDKERWQARPNVLFEAGLAYARDPKQVVFVQFGEVELFADVDGVHVIRPNNDPRGHRSLLRDMLRKSLGCGPVSESNAWMTDGDFETCVLPKPQPRTTF